MTRLYYTDPSRLTFDALVQRCEPAPASHPGAFAVWLSSRPSTRRRAASPSTPARLGDAKVVDVFEDDAGEVVHVVERPLEAGARVAGAVDGARRLDHRQQHSGQHVLSAAFVRTAERRDGELPPRDAVSTIDLAREVTPAEIARRRGRRQRRDPRAPAGDDPVRRRPRRRRRCRCARSRSAAASCASSTSRDGTCPPAAARTSRTPARLA